MVPKNKIDNANSETFHLLAGKSSINIYCEKVNWLIVEICSPSMGIE